jgi:hypothetical protein
LIIRFVRNRASFLVGIKTALRSFASKNKNLALLAILRKFTFDVVRVGGCFESFFLAESFDLEGAKRSVWQRAHGQHFPARERENLTMALGDAELRWGFGINFQN